MRTMSQPQISSRSLEVRSGRAELKRTLKAREPRDALLLAALHIENPAPDLRGMELRDLLMACPKVGKEVARRYMRDAAMDPWHFEIGELTVRERMALARVLRRPWAPSPDQCARGHVFVGRGCCVVCRNEAQRRRREAA
jgi:hypothetical protein